MPAIHCIVSGQVQGVFYRASTREKAESLNLTGWVRNMNDGSVELIAYGDDAALEALQVWLWQGPKAASVESVLTQSIEPEEHFTHFDIR